MIYLCSYVNPRDSTSGGVRKYGDWFEILRANGFETRLIGPHETSNIEWYADDFVVFQEVMGDALLTAIPSGIPRASFCQNGYLIDTNVRDIGKHPFENVPDLVAIFTESEHTTEIIRKRFPNLTVPVIRTHSSGNGRFGEDAGFSYGSWPREKRILWFEYKNRGSWTGPDVIGPLFDDLELPTGWSVETLTGLTDAEIASAMRTAAIFVAPNRFEGMCAPTSEAMISGCVIVGWTGGGTDEYLLGRGVIAVQDDINDLRSAVLKAVQTVDESSETCATQTAEWSQWFQRTYSRELEIAEIVDLAERFHGRAVAA